MLPDTDMLLLWQAMSDIYGHGWLSNYGEAVEGEEMSPTVLTWRRALAGITREELLRGIRDCERRDEDWPPNAGQFRARCRPNRPPYERPEFQRRALPKPSDPEVGRQHLNEIYRRLGRAPQGEAR